MQADFLSRFSEYQREKMLAYHRICQEIERDLEAAGMTVKQATTSASQRHQLDILPNGSGGFKPLPCSQGNMQRNYYLWLKTGRRAACFAPDYKPADRKCNAELINELHRLCTQPGVRGIADAINHLMRQWKAGNPIPGIGSWDQWYARNYPDFPLPSRAPEFPISRRTLYRHKPSTAAMESGNKSLAAARQAMPWITRDSSTLRPAEVITFDDVRLDLIAIDDLTKRPTEHQCYVAMEWGCRYIPAYVLRPGNGVISSDVDALVVMTLQRLGIGKDYATHLIFENGSLTMSRQSADIINNITDGRIKIHYTSMNRQRPHDGAPIERGKGHFQGKAVLESFFRHLHSALVFNAGQRGNRYENQPSTLGWVGQNSRPTKGTLAAEAQKLLDIDMASGLRLKLNLGLLWTSELNIIVRDAVKAYNAERGHDFQGFGTVTQIEDQPGIWKDVALCS